MKLDDLFICEINKKIIHFRNYSVKSTNLENKQTCEDSIR